MSSALRRVWFAALAVIALITGATVITAHPAPAAAAETFVVDTVADDGGLSACTAAAGDCSLRGALAAANGTGSADVIQFDIPSAACPGGVCRIDVTGGALEVNQPATIDATTQPQNDAPQSNVCAMPSEPSYMRVELVSANATNGEATVFEINHGVFPSTIKGFAFGTDDASGTTAAVRVTAGSHHIACNHFAVDAAGQEPLGTDSFAAQVFIDGSAAGVTVGTDGDGSDDVAERNVFGVGGYAVYVDDNNDNVIAGNFFGVTADGTTAVDSGRIYVKQSSSGNLIGTNGDGVSDDTEANHFGSSKGVAISADTGVDNQVIGNSFGIAPDGGVIGTGIAVQITNVGAANTGLQIRDNVIAGANTGIDITGTGDSASVLISGNVLGIAIDPTGDYGANTGIALRGSGSHVISDNQVFNSHTRGIYLVDTAGLGAGSTGNCIVGNNSGVVNDTGTGMVFENNWWGNIDGPGGEGPGSGDTVSLNVDYEPWTTTVPAPCNFAPVVTDGSFSIAEAAAIGDLVGVVDASDHDGTPLDFSITAGDPSGDFAVGPDGSITVAGQLDFETKSSYSLTVSASDGLAGDTATVTINILDSFETPETPSFDDVPLDNTFFANIEWLAFQGITRGCNPPVNDEFCPNAPVTRGQMAAFLHRAMGDTLNPTRSVNFKDIDDSVFTADIEWLGATGVTRGCNPPGNDEFCPGDVVTRGQMAAFLVRAFDYTEGAGSDRFSDDDGSVFEADVERLAEAGVTVGCNPPANDRFCPDDPVTRGQMAAFLYRAMGS